MSEELVRLDVTDRVATVTLASERNRNALSRQLLTELDAQLDAAEAHADARVIVLRSSHRVFCSGADLAEARAGGLEDSMRRMVALQRRLAASAKPVVVELAGPVRAGGLGMVGAADLVIASESATFALTEVRLGLAPAVVSLSLLGRLASRTASELFLSARTFDAAEAARIGLVTRAVPEEGLEAAMRSAVDALAEGSPQGLRETKKLLNADLLARIDRDGEAAARRSAELFAGDEARAAIDAFLSRGK